MCPVWDFFFLTNVLCRAGGVGAAVEETADVGAVIGTIVVTDPDNAPGADALQSHTCTVSVVAPTTPMGLEFHVTTDDQGINKLRFARGYFDFAAADVYNITLVCIDNGTMAAAASAFFLLHVLPVNKAPTMLVINGSAYPSSALASASLTPPPLHVAENLPRGAFIATVVTQDPDNCPFPRCRPLQSFTYAVSDNVGQSSSVFAISNGSVLSALAAVDYEATPTVELYVNVTDNGEPVQTGIFVIPVQVLDRNDPPQLTFEGTALIAHDAVGGTAVGTLMVFDQDSPTSPNGMHTLTIVIEEPASASPKFVLQGATLHVADDASFTPEEEYYLGIQVEDLGTPPLSGYLEITVTISAFNHAPSALVLSPAVTQLLVRENATNGDVLVRVSVVDADNPAGCERASVCPQAHTCHAHVTACFPPQPTGCVSEGREPLGFVSHALVVADASQLDFERVSTFTVAIACADDGIPATAPATTTLTVTVLDSNDAPYNLRVIPAVEAPPGFGSGALVVPEDAADGYVVGVVSADDADPGQTLSFGIGPVGGTTADIAGADTPFLPFALVGTSLVVRLPSTTSTGLDFEAMPVYNFALTVIDSGYPAALTWTVVTLWIADVNEAPTDITYSCGCRGSPCQHGGACVPSDGDAMFNTCSCNFGFSGTYCESSATMVGVASTLEDCLLLSPTAPTGPAHAVLHVLGVDPDTRQAPPTVAIVGTSTVFGAYVIVQVFAIVTFSMLCALAA